MSLQRFINAQQPIYPQVTNELLAGCKRSHWMWYIFPQIIGLGRSETAIYYAITDTDEAEAYIQHPILGTRLLECSELVLNIDGKGALEIFGAPDDMKLRSCMTLFNEISNTPTFQLVIDKHFGSTPDAKTLEIINAQ